MNRSRFPIVLTVAGSDSGGGAGIQADLKTFSALGAFGTSAITAITAQNTHRVSGVQAVEPAMVAAQMDAVLGDMPVGAVKTGMLFSAGIACAVADVLARHPAIPLVLDPVMIATSGDRLIEDDAVAVIVSRLLPRATVITPNLGEAAFLTGQAMAGDEMAMAAQGRVLLGRGASAVLVKGGHGAGNESIDLLVEPAGFTRFAAPRIDTANTHGTGCTLSAAIAVHLAAGRPLADAIAQAKIYLTAAIAAAQRWNPGSGRGPVQHFHAQWPAAAARVV